MKSDNRDYTIMTHICYSQRFLFQAFRKAQNTLYPIFLFFIISFFHIYATYASNGDNKTPSDQYVQCGNLDDDSVPINNALILSEVVKLMPGSCKVHHAIHIPAGHSLIGSGRLNTSIKIDTNFDMGASAIIECEHREPGCLIEGLEIIFSQPETNNRESLYVYPSAIDVRNAPRARLSRIRIVGANTAINAEGNAGGLLIDDLEISAFDIAIALDGSLDTIRINNTHLWPFGLSPNQRRILADRHTIGIKSGRVDGLLISGLVSFDIQNSILLYESSIYGGGTLGSMVNSGLDDGSSFVCKGGASFTISATYWTIGLQRDSYNLLDGCNVTISSSYIFANPDISGSIFTIKDSNKSSTFVITGLIMRYSSDRIRPILLDGLERALHTQVMLANNSFPANSTVAEVKGKAKVHIDGLPQKMIHYQ